MEITWLVIHVTIRFETRFYTFADTLPELLVDVELEYGVNEIEKVHDWAKISKNGDEYVSKDGRMHIFNIARNKLKRFWL